MKSMPVTNKKIQSLMRKPYDSELDFFQKNPTVAGMATEDDRVILNPYSNLSDTEKQSVALNEAARVKMKKDDALKPKFELTKDQEAFLNSNSYQSANDDDRKATIAARILSGDPSAGKPTDEQLMFVDTLRKSLADQNNDMDVPEFAKGGIVENEMNKLFAEGGVMQEGGTVDPVSGNEVPVGAMQEEVRDDIDAKLSVGEFVFPADVVRFIGLQTLMKLRDKAKAGLKRMEEIGQMGNAEEVPDGEALFGDEEMDDDMFSSEIDSIMAEED
jgi:hypothetical protein